MATINRFYQFSEDLAKKKHDLSSDTIKVMLSNSEPLNSYETKSEITEISAGNGYPAGGRVASVVSCEQSLGVLRFILSDVVFTATGSIGPFRYIILYNDTQTSPSKPLIGWLDYGSNITLVSGESFTVDFDNSVGVFTIY